MYSDADKAEVLADSLELQCTLTYENVDLDYVWTTRRPRAPDDRIRHTRRSLEDYDENERSQSTRTGPQSQRRHPTPSEEGSSPRTLPVTMEVGDRRSLAQAEQRSNVPQN